MSRRAYTDDQKTAALELYREHGPTHASKVLGIPKGTITKWGRAAGIETVSSKKTAAATEAAKVSMEARRQALAEGLMDDAEKLRSQLFGPCVEKKVVLEGDGKGYSHPEIVTIDHDEPSFGDKQRILTSIGIAVDKVQLLTGQATERHEHIGAEQAGQVMDELTRRVAKVQAAREAA
jgi:hypothetical protein